MPISEEQQARDEFNVIRDVLRVPLRVDLLDLEPPEFPKHRRWLCKCLQPLLPDLVPVNPDPALGPLGLCKRVQSGVDKGKLVVTVKNRGLAPAAASITRVTFSPGGSVDLPTGLLDEGASVDLKVDIPGECFNPDCDFTITVNADGKVQEYDDQNNYVEGKCIG